MRRTIVLGLHWFILWLSKHWLAAANVILFLYAGLPFLAPILLANGYTASANAIYRFYHVACHQLPSRSYFVAGQQVAYCQRDVSIYTTILLGGLFFGLVREHLKPIALRWYVFFMVPIALDAGLQLASEWLRSAPMVNLWAIGLVAMGITSAILFSQNYLTWHSYIFFAFGPLALIYLQFFGPYASDLYRRSITGFIFGFGTVWFAYPLAQEGFKDIQKKVMAKLEKANQRLEQ
jgi:uncharacterized membrane protein